MNIATLIARSAWFHRRANLLVALGTMVATAILTGARLTGDSFRFSLAQLAQQRLGDTRFALQARNRDFPADLASRLAAETGAPVIPVLTAPGVAVFNPLTEAPPRQINAVQVLGVDPTFWSLAPGAGLTLADDAVALNARLAAALNVRPGDRIALRLRRPSLMPEDAPLASRGDPFTRISLRVTAIVPDTQLGRFNLNADQRSPYNAFVPLPVIQDAIDRKGLANLLLVGKDAPAALDAVALNDALGRVWRIADGGVRVRAFPASGTLDVSSDRIFLDRAVAEAARPPAASADSPPAAGMLAYLVNSIATAGATVPHSTPYAFVAALSPSADSRLSPVPADMRDDEVIINRWLAKALAVGSGDRITLAYWRFQSVGGLSEESRPFRVRDVIEMDVLAAERERMPAFPGLRDAARCADWDIGLPMDEEKLRDKDNEAYWEQFGMTPKAFVTLAAGQAMWASPFGDLMSVRRLGAAPADVDALSAQLSRRVAPAALGLSFMPVRAWADWSLAGATDVGGLFLGMSSFLIIAALMLTALLFVFGLQQRASNLGLLRAVGFTNRQVARLALWEGAVVAACGAVPGAWAGTLYTRALIAALGGPWSPSVGGTPITYHAAPGTVSISGAIGFVCALAAMALTLRALLREPALQLLQADFSQSRSRATAGGPARRLLASLLAPTALAAALGVMTWTLLRPPPNPSEPFFLAGALMLAGCLGLARGALGRGAGAPTSADRLTLAGVGVRNITRRRGRSMAVIALFACGAFLVLAVASMRQDPGARAHLRDSGTGGYALCAETTLPLPADFDTAAGRARLHLRDAAALQDAQLIAIKVRAGDEAGCLNLQRARMPRLLGVPVEALRRDGAFAAPANGPDPWRALTDKLPDGAIPALAGDRDTAMWSLSKSLTGPAHDQLTYVDEQGREVAIRIVGSLPHRLTVFHGSVLIAMEDFQALYPSEGGYRMLLADVPAARQDAVQRALIESLAIFGLDVEPAVQRLAAFLAVEQVYLSMFLMLGGFGLLLGSAGLGIVLLRQVRERRGELAVLAACGLRARRLRGMLWLEHAVMLAIGLACGGLATAVAALPAWLHPGAGAPFTAMALTLAAVLALGLLAAWLATRAAAPRDFLQALREE